MKKIIRDFFKFEAFGGVLLFLSALIALIFANSPWGHIYQTMLNTDFIVQIGLLKIQKPLVLWINEGLMTVYFLLVGLELKRELFRGNYDKRSMLILPLAGAVGGLILPILIYSALNTGDQLAMRGWAIPAATDIAFSLGILACLGRRVPLTLKLFLASLAIFDDIGAIVIIAIFYSKALSLISFAVVGLCVLSLISLNRRKIRKLWPYTIVGIILWVSVLNSGVHATLAGVIIALSLPMDHDAGKQSLAMRIENNLLPWVTYFILPLFAFGNAGFSFSGINLSSLFQSIPLGIALGLIVGKQLGIFSACWLLIKLKITQLPRDISLGELYGVAIICGVGFTMSLFIGSLAYQGFEGDYSRLVRLGVLAGSLISGVVGYFVLRNQLKKRPIADKTTKSEDYTPRS